jgi:hypothetical protein
MEITRAHAGSERPFAGRRERGMCRDSNGGVIEHRQRRRSLALTQNDLLEQYFVILRS